MATLRLFASIRETAGTGETDISATTVQEMLDQAVEKFGPDFREHLSCCRIWINGEPAESSDAVQPQDEVALLPPVSGGQSQANK